MARERILIIDDEPAVTRAVSIGLAGYGFLVDTVGTGAAGLARVRANPPPQVVLLDLGLPDGDGLAFCAQIRAESTVPIIVLTAREAEHEKIRALEGGADDYVTKPFGMGELLARIRVALRHAAAAQPVAPAPLQFGDLEIDPTAHTVRLRSQPVHLTPTEFKLLITLAGHAGRVSTHQFLLREVWGPGHSTETQLLRVFIGQLRTKLERDPADPDYIHTEPALGYRFCAPDEIIP